jgi:hypothetical protein
MTQATEYAILLPGDESAWERATEAERAATYARHEEFMRLLAERGHRITGGAELTPARTAHVVRGEPSPSPVPAGAGNGSAAVAS